MDCYSLIAVREHLTGRPGSALRGVNALQTLDISADFSFFCLSPLALDTQQDAPSCNTTGHNVDILHAEATTSLLCCLQELPMAQYLMPCGLLSVYCRPLTGCVILHNNIPCNLFKLLMHLQEVVALRMVLQQYSSRSITCSGFTDQCCQAILRLAEEQYVQSYIEAHS